MAAGTYTLVSVLDEMKLRLEGKVSTIRLTDDQYEGFIYPNLITSAQTYQFQQTSTVYRLLNQPAVWLDLPATGAVTNIPDDTAWTLYANGTLKQESGTTYTGASLTVVGSPVNFNWAMADAFDMMIALHSSDMSMTTGAGTTADVTSVKQELRAQAAVYRGAQGV